MELQDVADGFCEEFGVPVAWAVDPPLNAESYDVMLFRSREEAEEYIAENIAEKLGRDYTDEGLIRDGFTLTLRGYRRNG